MANPYNFVPIAEVKREKLPADLTHKQINSNLLSGIIECTLTVKSFLCIKSIFKELGNKEVYIPGSSIKGMIRMVMEALYGGCGFKVEKDYDYERDDCFNPRTKAKDHVVKYHVNNCKFPDGKYENSIYISCNKKIDDIYKRMSEDERKNISLFDFELCPICSIFGITTESGFSFSGRLSFEDTKKIKVELKEHKIPRPDEPRVYRRSFYFKNPRSLPPPDIQKGEHTIKTFEGGEYNGRKFYLHSKDGKISPGDFESIYSAPKDTTFTFKVHFKNLSEDDLAKFLFAINLDENTYHKLGYGKPIGMGSVKITINYVKTYKTGGYQSFERELPIKDYDFTQCLERFKKSSQILETEQFKKLKEIWGMPGNELAYPDLKFFGNKNYINTTIAEFNSEAYRNAGGVDFKKKKSITEDTEKKQKNKKTKDNTYAIKRGDTVKGFVKSIEGLNGIARLETGEEVPFTRQNEYIPVKIGQKASFKVTQVAQDGKIAKLEFKK